MFLSIPEYFRKYVSKSIDLDAEPHISCPFHNETHGKSFSYSPQKQIWRCFGACKAGGDIYDLHKLNYHLKTRAEAVQDLNRITGVSEDTLPLKPVFDSEAADSFALQAVACSAAVTPDDWDELDYIMSFFPIDISRLQVFADSRQR